MDFERRRMESNLFTGMNHIFTDNVVNPSQSGTEIALPVYNDTENTSTVTCSFGVFPSYPVTQMGTITRGLTTMGPNTGVDVDVELAQEKRLKKELRRERNRRAAAKCRQRKLERIAALQGQVNNYQAMNNHLIGSVEQLRREIDQLRQLVADHQHGGCPCGIELQSDAEKNTYKRFKMG